MFAFTQPRVSVIVCVRNRPEQILHCLESLAASDYVNFEVVVVDDGSTDHTPEVVEQFAADRAEGFVRLVRNPQNRGVSGARNSGIAAAAGEIILFTDSDCIVASDWISRMVDAFLAEPVDAVCGTVRDPYPRNLVEQAFFGNTTLRKTRWQTRLLVGNNMGFRRSVFDKFEFDDMLTYGCDEDDVARQVVQSGGTIGRAPEAVVEHHHPMTLRGYLNQAKRQGQGSARYWFKYGQYVGRDVLFQILGLATLGLGLVDVRLLVVPLLFWMLQIAALVFNELALKGTSVLSAIEVLPIVAVHNLVKSITVVWTLGRIFTGFEPKAWVSRARVTVTSRSGRSARRPDRVGTSSNAVA